jgi:hypothetical protein
MATKTWTLESFGDSRTAVHGVKGWRTREALVAWVRHFLGLTVARDGYVYATRNTHTDAIGRVRREGEQGEVEP